MENHLHWGGVDTIELTRKFGTPLYVMDAGTVKRNWIAIHEAMTTRHKRTTICYAYKANSHLAICKMLTDLGAGAEVASGGELYAALKVGVPPDRIVFDGPNKSIAELETAIKSRVMINVDSPSEIKKVQVIAKGLGIKARIGMRVNPNIPVETHPHLSTAMSQHKFGVSIDSMPSVFEFASNQDMIEIDGLHVHLGSEILDVRPFDEACRVLLDLSDELLDKFGIEIRVMNLGGGIGISYTGNETIPFFDEFADTIATRLRQESNRASELTLILELGRSLVASAGILLTKVGVVKRTPVANWALVDSGMNHLIRPALYDAFHRIAVANKMNSPNGQENYFIGGPCCESGDVLGKNRTLPFLEEDDILAVMDVGAYGFTMSSNYNSYPRPLVVLVNEGVGHVIRERESYEDVFRLERIPAFLS
ncbi:MAG: diaminopimelate decarboxylase [Candidatus Bathyarchaeia archaeon]